MKLVEKLLHSSIQKTTTIVDVAFILVEERVSCMSVHCIDAMLLGIRVFYYVEDLEHLGVHPISIRIKYAAAFLFQAYMCVFVKNFAVFHGDVLPRVEGVTHTSHNFGTGKLSGGCFPTSPF
jgi:hypothetical protein